MPDLDWQQIPGGSAGVERAALSSEGVIVEFRGGRRYLYRGTGEGDLAGLVMSPSPGSYVRRVLGDGERI